MKGIFWVQLGVYFPGPMIKAQHYPLVVSHPSVSPPIIATHENQPEPGNTGLELEKIE